MYIYKKKAVLCYIVDINVISLGKNDVIVSGLNKGDVVVTAGVHKLYEGQSVKLADGDTL